MVALRLSTFYDYQAGYFKRSYCTDPAAAMALTCTPLSSTGVTTVDNVGAINTYGGAASLTIKPNDSLTITPRLMMQRAGYNGFPMGDYLTDTANGIGYPVPTPATGVATPSLMYPTSLTQRRWFNVPEGGYDAWGLYSIGVNWKTGLGDFVSSTAFFSRKVFETEDETDFVYGNITSGAGGAPEPGGISEEKDYQRFVEEVRFASALQGPMQFVAGGFYSDFHGRLPFAAYYPPAEIPNLDNTLGGPNNPYYPNLIFAQDFHTDIKEPAVFGEVSYQPVDALKVTGGMRWYQVKTTSSGYEEGLAAGGGPAVESPLATTTETGVNPKIEADYHITPDQMVYTLAAKGFRPGGLVPIVPAGTPGTGTDCVAALHQVDPNITLADTRSYRSDSLWNYEIGTKTAWLDHRLTFDAAVFYIKWSNIQQEILLSCGFQYNANAGAAVSKGGEMELRARPTEPLELSLGLGYQDAKITAAGAVVAPDRGIAGIRCPRLDGQRLDFLYDAAIERLEAGERRRLFLYRQELQRQQRCGGSPRDSLLSPHRCAIRVRERPMEISLVGKNLADEITNLGDSRSIAAETPGRPRLLVNQPRTIGLDFKRSF